MKYIVPVIRCLLGLECTGACNNVPSLANSIVSDVLILAESAAALVLYV